MKVTHCEIQVKPEDTGVVFSPIPYQLDDSASASPERGVEVLPVNRLSKLLEAVSFGPVKRFLATNDLQERTLTERAVKLHSDLENATSEVGDILHGLHSNLDDQEQSLAAIWQQQHESQLRAYQTTQSASTVTVNFLKSMCNDIFVVIEMVEDAPRFDAESEIYHTLAFLASVMIWSQITDLPFSLYSTFVIEERYGFDKQTFWLFMRDMVKNMILAIILGSPVMAAIILIVQGLLYVDGPNNEPGFEQC